MQVLMLLNFIFFPFNFIFTVTYADHWMGSMLTCAAIHAKNRRDMLNIERAIQN